MRVTLGLMLMLISLNCWGQNRQVFINELRLPDNQVKVLENYYQVRIQDGQYWYDAINGWWGNKGQAVAGIIQPGLSIGGPLKAQASNGKTGVYINGRQINQTELFHLQQIIGTSIVPGKYWLDAYGNAGPMGGYATCNVYQLANRGKSTYNKSFATDIGYGSNGKDFYIMGKDFSYTNF